MNDIFSCGVNLISNDRVILDTLLLHTPSKNKASLFSVATFQMGPNGDIDYI